MHSLDVKLSLTSQLRSRAHFLCDRHICDTSRKNGLSDVWQIKSIVPLDTRETLFCNLSLICLPLDVDQADGIYTHLNTHTLTSSTSLSL